VVWWRPWKSWLRKVKVKELRQDEPHGSEPMKVKILSQKRNPLIKRTEVTFEIEHGGRGGTPLRLQARGELAATLKTKIELVYIKKLETKTGASSSIGEANVYDSMEQAKLVEPEYIVARHIPEEKPKEE